MTAVAAFHGAEVDAARTCTSEVLLDRIAHRDHASFAALYERFLTPVWSLTALILRREETSERVVRDLFVDIWRSSPRYEPTRGTAEAWVLELTRRRAIDALKVVVRDRETTSPNPAAAGLGTSRTLSSARGSDSGC